MIRNKRAVSEVVAYVLLISISLTLASMVFVWLKGYLPSDNSPIECEENVALIIKDVNYSCNDKSLNFSVQNKGLFDVSGYITRVNNISAASLGIYTLNKTGVSLVTGDSYREYYSHANQTDEIPSKTIGGVLTLLEVQPFLIKNGKVVYCNNFVAKQSLSC